MKKIFGLLFVSMFLIGAVGCNVTDTNKSEDKMDGSSDSEVVMDDPVDLSIDKTEGESRMVDPKSFDYAVLPSIELIDVTNSGASGTAYYGFVEGLGTRHQVIARNMPELTNGDFYEGWLVRGDQFFSTGKMKKEGDDFVLYWVNHLDDTPFRKVVITLEPDDGNDLPAAHVIENEFPDDQDLNVVL